MMLNPQEVALTNIPPVFSPPVSPATMNGAKASRGLMDVPTDLLSPFGGLVGGLAGALTSPMPSLTATVNSDPSVKYGDRYMENLVGASKAGQFIVQSGSTNANADNRGGESSAQGLTPAIPNGKFSMPVWVWGLVSIGVIVGVLSWRRR